MTDRARILRQYSEQWCQLNVKKVFDNLFKRAFWMINSQYFFDRMYVYAFGTWPFPTNGPCIYEVCLKNKVNFQILRTMYIRFSIIFSYVGTLVPNVCSQFQQYSIFCLFVRGIKVRSVLRVLAIFCCRKKWIEEYASNFVLKMELSNQKHLKCWKWHTLSVL